MISRKIILFYLLVSISYVLTGLPADAATLHGTITQGNAALASGKLDEALAAYEEAVKLDPLSPPAQFNLGVARYLKGDLAKAREAFEQVLTVSRDAFIHARAQQAIGNCAYRASMTARQEKPDAAIASLQEGAQRYRAALDLDPAFNDAAHNLELARQDIEAIRVEMEQQKKQQEDEQKRREEIKKKLEELVTRQAQAVSNSTTEQARREQVAIAAAATAPVEAAPDAGVQSVPVTAEAPAAADAPVPVEAPVAETPTPASPAPTIEAQPLADQSPALAPRAGVELAADQTAIRTETEALVMQLPEAQQAPMVTAPPSQSSVAPAGPASPAPSPAAPQAAPPPMDPLAAIRPDVESAVQSQLAAETPLTQDQLPIAIPEQEAARKALQDALDKLNQEPPEDQQKKDGEDNQQQNKDGEQKQDPGQDKKDQDTDEDKKDQPEQDENKQEQDKPKDDQGSQQQEQQKQDQEKQQQEQAGAQEEDKQPPPDETAKALLAEEQENREILESFRQTGQRPVDKDW